MYHVLLPIGTNIDRALIQAEFVVSLPNATSSVEATIVHSWQGRIDTIPQEGVENATINHVGSVKHVTDFFEENEITYKIIDGAGEPSELILDVVADIDPDLIALGGRKRSAVGKAIFGSVTQSVILNTDVSVVVTGDQSE